MARQFGRSYKASVIWEINAETKMSLIDSFRDLASELAQTKHLKEILIFIQNIQDSDEKNKQLFSFVKQRLKRKL